MTDDTGRATDEPTPASGEEEPTVTRSGASDDQPHTAGGTVDRAPVSPEEAGTAVPALGEGPAARSRDGAPAVPQQGSTDPGGPHGAPPAVTPAPPAVTIAERSATTAEPSPDPSISGAARATSDLGRGSRRPAPAGTLIWVLLALLGFSLVVQLRSNDADDGLSAARQEDLVRILSDLEAQDSRLLAEIQALEQSKQQLNSEVGGREAALAEAEKRSRELGLLAGTVPGRGPGLDITLSNVKAADVLNAVQELRGAGGEVMQLNGANGASVRVVASSFFVAASGGGIIADGEHLTGPLHLLVIGPSGTMSTALQIPGGVVASAKSDGGSVTMDSRSLVEVTAVRKAAALRYASPVS
ncbi:DUF881 domain-containing protein [Actinoplanes utahensis]|uniref:DUF881 domain-containing protein n=1 Tax=Actinoplanes utahensis TaxID=1869 RepID=UPI000A71C091|nr:DUF881 domain-containing protein [Actinoplanes utahensis]GIF27496.1 hypothetical protein Aut01nite_04820 [Actinoplanes utahensis]